MPDMKTLTINGVQYNIVDPNARPADWMPTAEQVGARANDWMPTAEEVGARANTWLPTIAEIGAAPAGFGFGEQAIELSSGLLKSEAELDTALETIYSKMENSETKLIRFAGYPDNSDYNWYGFLFRSSANYGSLIMQSAYAKGSLISKAKYESTWQPLEWVNPPMAVGVEYRTTERWEGKPVYTKLVSLGAFTNPLVVTLPGYNAMRVIEAHGELRISENSDNTMMVPGRMNGSNEVWIDQSFAYSQQLRFRSTDGWDWPIGRPFYLRLKYWKYTG